MTTPKLDMTTMFPMAEVKSEAMMKSGEIWLKGLQTIAELYAETSKQQIASMVESWKEVAAAKTMADIRPIQAKLAKDLFDRSMSDTNRLVGEFVSLTERTMAAAASGADTRP